MVNVSIGDTALRDKVCDAYSAAAVDPNSRHPFPVGRQFAESLGYPPETLDSLPPGTVAAFAGVSNVSILASIPPGATLLDLGCGSGTDSLISAQRVGPSGRVIAVDFSEAMLERARSATQESGLENIEFRLAAAEHLPLDDASVNVAIVNGIFNLNPARDAIFRELARVVAPGGSLFAAELVLQAPLPLAEKSSEANWFA
jgi:arsenite methyltransferase